MKVTSLAAVHSFIAIAINRHALSYSDYIEKSKVMCSIK